jgi:hypothetical protein
VAQGVGDRVASKFNPDIDEFKSLYEQLKSSRKMGAHYNVDKATILNFCKKIGYKREVEMLLSDSDIEFIVDNYNNYSSRELAERFKCSRERIKQVWMKNGLKGKRNLVYYANFNYFNKLDTKDKAYFLGFIASDGNVWKRERENANGQLKISIHEKDIDVLHKIQKYMNSNHNLTKYIFNRKDSEIVTNVVSLTIVSDIIFNDLEKLNITPNKTWSYKPVGISEELKPHFIRGFFDGDGSITLSSEGYFSVKIAVNEHVGKYISEYLKENNIHHNLTEDKREYTGGRFYSVGISRITEIEKFYNLVYKDCDDLYMDRKYNRFQSFLERFCK